MAGYVSKFATGAAIEAILDKANNSQSVSATEKTNWNAANTIATGLVPVAMVANDNVDTYRIDTSLSGRAGRKIWYCPSSAVASSLTGLPTDASTDLGDEFTIEYQQTTQTTGIQILKGSGTSTTSYEPYIATRTYDGSTWGNWCRYRSGSSYSETELISSPLVGAISSITLNDDMNNYDQLVFTFGVHAADRDQRFTKTILVSDIDTTNSLFIDGMVYSSSYYGAHFVIVKHDDTTFDVIESGQRTWSEQRTIFSIKGIKF